MTTGLKVDYFPLNCAGGKYEVPLKLDKITFHSLKNCTVCRIPTAERLLPAFISNHPFIEKLWLSGIVFFLFCWIISKIKRFLEKSEKLLIRAARLFYGTAENTFSDFFFPPHMCLFPTAGKTKHNQDWEIHWVALLITALIRCCNQRLIKERKTLNSQSLNVAYLLIMFKGILFTKEEQRQRFQRHKW